MTEFVDAMRAVGVDPGATPIVPDSVLHRFRGPGDKPGRENCWYVLFEYGGAFGSWRLGIDGTWSAQRNGNGKLSAKDRKRIKEQIGAAKAQAEAERRERQANAAAKARRVLSRALNVVDSNEHQYLSTKQIQPHTAKRSGQALCISMRDVGSSEIVNVQFIRSDGTKRFIEGGRVAGCYHPIADAQGKFTKIAVAEGFATAASIHEATSIPVAVAFNASNLLAVAKALRKKYREAEIIVCGDDDRTVDGNPGVTKARQAAAAVGGRLAIPTFPEGVKGTDFNDLGCALGVDAVRNQIVAAMSSGIPPNFKLTEDGLYLLKEVKDKNGNPHIVEHPVSSRIEVTALTRDSSGENWGRLLGFTDPDGRQHEWAMPAQMLSGDGREYRARLFDQGLRIWPSLDAKYGLHEYLTNCRPQARACAVNRIGWHSGAFVLPDVTFGNARGERTLYQSAVAERHNFNISGTLENWQCEIATRCVGNSRLAFAVSAAFAAALLDLVNGESGGFHFVGLSSLGKTTAARVAGSVWGGSPSQQGYLRQWRATSNGLEGIAALHCDTLLPLDELSEVNPREAGSIAYMLANGHGKARARADGSARVAFEWRLLFLSTGEITLADKVKEDPRQRATAGQSVRVLDIPAKAGAYGLFEDLHGAASGQAFADQLKDATQKYYGTAIRAFLTEIVEQRGAVAAAVQKHQHAFLKECCAADAHGQVNRAAARFALVAAAGELATALGITRWDEGAATGAAKQCFEAYLKMRGHSGAAEIEAGIEQVRTLFIQYGASRFAAADLGDVDGQGRTVLNRAGFKNGSAYCVHPAVFKNEITAGFDWRAIAEALAERGLLRRDKEANLTCTAKNPDSRKTIRVFCFEPDITGEEAVEN
ncbi:MAG: DUF927 domain-containing protein [Candidatus Binataceae bacterium]